MIMRDDCVGKTIPGYAGKAKYEEKKGFTLKSLQAITCNSVPS